jgi:hypothetical protein
MNYDLEYQLQEFRGIQEQYFDGDGKLWGGLSCANMSSIMGQMLTLINALEVEIDVMDIMNINYNLEDDKADMEMFLRQEEVDAVDAGVYWEQRMKLERYIRDNFNH